MKLKTLLLFFFLYLPSHSLLAFFVHKPAIQQGVSFQQEKTNLQKINEYYISEKLDGMRGYWNGRQLLSRQGNVINHPLWFTQHWPETSIDGELWIARDNFQSLLSCVRKEIAGVCWQKVSFMMFDLPDHKGRFVDRVNDMKGIAERTHSPYLKMIEQQTVTNLSELERKLEQVIDKKGEGLMLHLASAYYYVGRTDNLLKLKKNQDAEAVIIEHLPGKGKYQQMLGAIRVKTENGITFKIGSGFTDKERANPPAIGSTITYKYNGLTKAGIPRFARYWRLRESGQ